MLKKTSNVFFLCITLPILTILLISACSRTQGYGWSHPRLSQEAVSKFIGGIRPYRGEAQSHYLAAVYFQERRKHKLAVEEFRTAVEIDPAYVKAHNGMGVSYDFLGDHVRAIESYKAALQVDQNLDYVLNNLGYAYLLQGDPDLAIDSFQKAIAVNNRNARYHNNLGLAYAKAGKYGQALDEFRLTGDESKAHQNLARIFYRNGQYDDALVHFAKAKTMYSSGSGADPALKQADPPVEIPAVAENIAEREIKPEENPEINREDNNPPRTLLTGQPGSTGNPEDAQTKRGDIIKKDEPRIQENGEQERRYAVNTVVSESVNKAGEDAVSTKESVEDKASAGQNEPGASQHPNEKGPGQSKTVSATDSPVTPVISVSHRSVLEVSNGNGVNRMSRKVGNYLHSNGFKLMYLTNADHYNHQETTIYYRSGHLQQARMLAQKLPGRQKMEEASHFEWESAELRVVIGKDLIPHMRLFQNI
jgi:Flp pilus assembly protein TadD